AVQHHDGIVHAALSLQGRTDDDTRTAISRIRGKLRHRLLAGSEERRLQNQVFRRITSNEKLGEEHQIRPELNRLRTRLPRLLKVTDDVADSRVKLRDGNTKHGIPCAGRRPLVSSKL